MNAWRQLFATVRADLAAMVALKRREDLSVGGVVDVLALPGTWAVLIFRLASACHRGGLRPVSRILYFLNVVVFGADLAAGARIGPGLAIAHPVGVAIGSDVVAGSRLVVTGLIRLGGAGAEDPRDDGMPVLGDDVWLLDGAKVFGRVRIGDRAVVAANSLVLSDVPAEAIVRGQPARVVRNRYAEPSIAGQPVADQANAEQPPTESGTSITMSDDTEPTARTR